MPILLALLLSTSFTGKVVGVSDGDTITVLRREPAGFADSASRTGRTVTDVRANRRTARQPL